MSELDPPRRPARPRWLTLLLQLTVSVGLLAVLVGMVDWGDLHDALAALSTERLLAVFLLCFGAQAMYVLRWRALTDMLGIRDSWSRSWHTVFAGLFLVNFLPGTLGSDGLRVVLLTKSCGRASTAVGAIAYDRLMQLALYVLVVAAAVTPMDWLQPWLRAVIVVGGLGAVIVLIYVLYWLGRRSRAVSPTGGGFVQTAWRLFATILTETGRMQTRMRRHRRAALGFWLANLFNIGLVVAMWQVILLDIGEAIGLPALGFAVGGGMIVGAVPISINGLGTFESANVLLLSLAGVMVSHGFLVALVLRASFVAVSFIGLPSAILLWRERGS